MASGALPPGFAPVIIKDRAYWDGGIYSNTPIDIVLDDADRRDSLCFMIDLWDATEAHPRSINQAMARQKDIQYASRSNEHLEDHRKLQELRRAIHLLAEQLPAKAKADPKLQQLVDLGCQSNINIVHLVMKAMPDEDQYRDIDFSKSRLAQRWTAGSKDAERALAHKAWLKPLPPQVGLVIHELEQRA